jgi:hypothetical protein
MESRSAGGVDAAAGKAHTQKEIPIAVLKLP